MNIYDGFTNTIFLMFCGYCIFGTIVKSSIYLIQYSDFRQNLFIEAKTFTSFCRTPITFIISVSIIEGFMMGKRLIKQKTEELNELNDAMHSNDSNDSNDSNNSNNSIHKRIELSTNDKNSTY
jgi:hypothetical protein